MQAVFGEQAAAKWRDRPFGFATGLFEKDLSRALFCFVHHEGADKVPGVAERTGPGRILLCGAGFSAESRPETAGGTAAGAEGQGGIPVQ